MNTTFSTLSQVIKSRRTIKPNQFNGRQIPDEQISQLLELADWAPTHAYTEPWRFKVFAGEKVQQFCLQHAELYKDNTDPENFQQAKYDKLLRMGNFTSHVIIAIMQRGDNSKIPVLEEIASTSCAVQNLLLGATALGIASYWGSGGMAYQPPMKTYLKLREEDLVLGILYLGYTDKETPEGKRNTPLDEKIDWQWIE
ncbi:nitroreductase [Adhaeribacter sp. BT258]|uniref:Putative NAD(P)H nitroreductase n=1 Tax=Adhaeribacter terrigena TaxID=2793070 RepID=A0ABS1BZE2_9BACT|nr:nitroreductase [Adhaeribacter terrigena]MBK0402480.1 nitroreductase [Adhaeribacter terrigena]